MTTHVQENVLSGQSGWPLVGLSSRRKPPGGTCASLQPPVTLPDFTTFRYCTGHLRHTGVPKDVSKTSVTSLLACLCCRCTLPHDSVQLRPENLPEGIDALSPNQDRRSCCRHWRRTRSDFEVAADREEAGRIAGHQPAMDCVYR